MKLPSKVTSYKESTISKFPIILKLLKEKDYTVSSLYTKIKNKISINDNVDVLITSIKKYIEEQERIYDEDDLTNVSTKFIMSELVREKVLELTKDEIPHSVTCYVENYEEDDKLVHIQVLIVVDRDNLKKILIGKNGSMLKQIGTLARHDMEEFLGKKVFLETYVKTLKNWRDQEKYFDELGLKEIE